MVYPSQIGPPDGSDDGAAGGLNAAKLLELYQVMLTARALDRAERELVQRGEAFYHVSGSGHEGAAILHYCLGDADWLHCHERDKALLLARGVPVETFFHRLLGYAAAHTAGRKTNAPMSDPARRILSIAGPAGNSALQAVGVAAEIKHEAERPLVLCSMGDGTSQQGEVLEAIAEAARLQLPILFWIEDNRRSIPTLTAGKAFHNHLGRAAAEFYGLPIHRFDGRDPAACHAAVSQMVSDIRTNRGPAIAVFEVERFNQTHGDVEATDNTSDPLCTLARQLVAQGVPQQQLDAQAQAAQELVRAAADAARHAADSQPAKGAKQEHPAHSVAHAEYRGTSDQPRLTMSQAIREVLRARMDADQRIALVGEDIEDAKDDRQRVTGGLSAAFPGRVLNSALSESAILSTCIGRALAGGRPVAFLQFADFLPRAFNQIACELATTHGPTSGARQCPIIVMIACGAYRPGLGPFHGQTWESIAAHVPGLDMVMPSSAADAAGLLNAAFESQRPTLFFYPKGCLNDLERDTSSDVERQLVPPGKARRVHCGNDLTLVSWGSTVPVCERTAEILQRAGSGVDLIDVRSISPWDAESIRESVERTGRLLVVHEDNITSGFGAEVVAQMAETARRPLACRRLARPETCVPNNSSERFEVVPSFKAILTAAADMLDWDVTWSDAREEPATPRLGRKPGHDAYVIPLPRQGTAAPRVGLSTVYSALGGGQRTNAELAQRFSGRTEQEIVRRTGIETRVYLGPGESALTLAVAAAERALAAERLGVADLSAIVCSTTTPLSTTPSMACRVLHALCGEQTPHEIPAHDVNAACTGYLYALAAGYDFICAYPDSRVLVVTAEAMSQVVNSEDFGTSILFGDAASATILFGPEEMSRASWTMDRPVLSARGESGELLTVPSPGAGFVKMVGRKVFTEAVVKMSDMLERACAASALALSDLKLIVPHQANGRIIEAIRERLELSPERVYNNIRTHGNTSSSSIPLCLAELPGVIVPGNRVGLCAFGGGFTFGAAILEAHAKADSRSVTQGQCA